MASALPKLPTSRFALSRRGVQSEVTTALQFLVDLLERPAMGPALGQDDAHGNQIAQLPRVAAVITDGIDFARRAVIQFEIIKRTQFVVDFDEASVAFERTGIF